MKRNKSIYWIATIWLCLGMLSSAIVQLLRTKEEVALFMHLGYPLYFLTVLAILKFIGVIILFVPKFLLLKEWAYAGFFFTMSGAVISHLVSGDSMSETFPAVLLLVLTFVSWYFRPAERTFIPLISK